MQTLGPRSVASALRLWIDVLFWIVAVGSILFVGVGAYFLAFPGQGTFGVEIPVLFQLDERVIPISSDVLDVAELTIGQASADADFDVVSRPLVAVYLASIAVLAAAVAYILWCLRRIFGSLVDRRPFTPENAGLIRRIGLIVLIGEVAATALEFAGQRYVRANFHAEGLTFGADLTLDLTAVFAGLVLLVLAEVFRIGSHMRKNEELTI